MLDLLDLLRAELHDTPRAAPLDPRPPKLPPLGLTGAVPAHAAARAPIGLDHEVNQVFFDDVRIPVSQRVGAEGQGFVYLMQELPWERLQIAVISIASAEAAARAGARSRGRR